MRSPLAWAFIAWAASGSHSEPVSSVTYTETTGLESSGTEKVARPKAYDRDAVITAARDLFWERGFGATSITDLEDRTGLNRSSIYAEFGSKNGLFEAALDCYADQVIVLLHDSVRHGGGLDAVAGLFTRLAELLDCHEILGTHG